MFLPGWEMAAQLFFPLAFGARGFGGVAIERGNSSAVARRIKRKMPDCDEGPGDEQGDSSLILVKKKLLKCKRGIIP